MKYEVSSDSKKTEFYTIKQIIESTFVYDALELGKGKEEKIDIYLIFNLRQLCVFSVVAGGRKCV